jgi:CheY-like chemotaxis protein
MSEKPLRVFLVDDNDIDLAVNTKLLKLARVAGEILSFQQAGIFLETIQLDENLQQYQNILLLDIMMPGISGFDCMEQFAKLSDRITSTFKVFMLSSSIDRNDIRKAGETPFVIRVLEKPLDTYLLKSLIGATSLPG